MRTITLSNGNINFIFVLMFLLTFVIILIIEIILTTYYKNRVLHVQTYTYTSSERTENFEEYTLKNTNTLIPRDAVWQPVTGTAYKFYVYSAFLDKRSKRQWVIKVIGATKTKFRDKAICIFHFKDRPDERMPARVRAIRENWNLPYSAVFIICNIKNNSHIPSSVSISFYNNQYSANKDIRNNLLIQNYPDLTFDRNKDKIAVCVKPIHYDYNKTVQLLEFIELNRLLGVSHFTFYNSSLSSSTNCILHHYLKKGTISVHSWHLDIRSQVEIRTEGMFAALNDCLYRNMYTYPYVAFIDLDEIITPQFNKTLNDLLKWLSIRYNTNQVSAYSFRNAFFYTQWNDDPGLNHANEIEKHLLSIRKTRRCQKLSPHTQRSKFIAKVKNVFEVGNHFVWQFLPFQNVLNVPPNMALLHHYRVCEFGGDGCINLPSVVDRTLHSYRRDLTCRIAEKWLPLNDQCGLPKLENFDYDDICKA